MSLGVLFSTLEQAGIRLSASNGQLNFRAPKGAMTTELKAQIRDSKADILRFFSEQESILPIEAANYYALSHAQQRIWMLSQIEQDGALFNVPLAYVVDGELDVARFKKSLVCLLERHEILRTVFPLVEGEPKQRVISSSSDCLEAIFNERDVQDLSPTEIENLLIQETAIIFDLEAGPLIKVLVAKESAQRQLLIITLHHIITDGWSVRLMMQELIAHYHTDPTSSSVLPALDFQYRDFSAWQNRQIQSGAMDGHQKFWLEQFSEGAPTLELHTDLARPAVQSFNGDEISFCFELELVEAIRQLGRRCSASFYITLVTLTQTLLLRHSQQESIVVGMPVSGRERSDLDDQLGLYINTIALKSDLPMSLTAVEAIEVVRNNFINAYEYQAYPFDLLVDNLDLDRDLSRSPLFDVMVILQESVATGDSESSLQLRPLPIPSTTSKYDLTFHLEERASELHLSIEYNTDLFSASRIKGLGEQFGFLAKQITASPDVPLHTFSVLSEIKEGLLLSQLSGQVKSNLYSSPEPSSDKSSNIGSDRNFIAGFREQALKSPSKTAITFCNEVLTYEQLDKQSDCLAAYLQDYFQRNSIDRSQCLVGLCVERSTEMLVSLLGILKSGAAYLPIDPEYPSDRIVYMLKDSGAQLVISEDALVKNLAQTCDANFICIDSQWDSICQANVNKLQRALDNESLAYVIYTSGSTGLPKGVEISHHALFNFLNSMAREPELKQQDRLLAVTTICFDIAALELFLPLLQGAEIVLAAHSDAIDGQKLIDLVGQHQVTCMQATPVTWKLMLSAGWKGSPLLKVLCGGEALSTQLAGELLPRCDQLWNMYGPTETTIWSLIARVSIESIAQSSGGIVGIGSPIENTTLLVLDRWGQIAAPGVSGELCIGGAGLARGYHDRPDLSADKFFLYARPQNQSQESLSQVNGLQQRRFYRTGDLVCVTEQGHINFLGRLDNQVKVRGYRIELGEIEALLGQSDLVSAAVVCAHKDSDDQNYLVAYIKPANNELQTNNANLLAVKSGLSEALPRYMVPDQFVLLDEFPLTANGKIDRKKLLQHSSGKGQPVATQNVPYVPAGTPLEKALVDIWQKVLEVQTIGIDDDFFELGGHSLKATRLVFRLQEETGLALRLLDIFKYPTISKLIENVTVHECIVPIESLKKAAAYDEEGESLWPLSRAQERLWLMHQLDLSLAKSNAGAAYNVSTGIALSGPLDVTALQLALEQIIQRHESLRTVFPTQVDGSPRQRVIDYSCLDGYLTFITLQGEQGLTGVVKDFIARPFDLVKGPLFKVLIVKVDDDLDSSRKDQEHKLLISLHHIVCDEWSIRIILQELLMLYFSHGGQDDLALNDLTIQYRDYAHWQNQRFANEPLEQFRAYWLAKIPTSPVALNLPADYPRPDEMDYHGDNFEFDWPPELNSAVSALGARAGQSQFMILTAMVKVLLFRYSGEKDITIGSPVLGRMHPDLENQVGNYVNMLALRDVLSPHESFLIFLDQIKETISGALEHQEYPFDQLVEDLSVARELGRHPVFDVLISLESQSADDRLISRPAGEQSIDSQMTALKITPYGLALPVAKYDLSFYFTETEEGLRASINFRTSLFKRQRIERLAGHLVQLARSIVRQPETPLCELELLTEPESRELLSYNQTAADYPKGSSLVDLWSAQVLKNPNAVAVVYRNIQMTYQEIDEAASRLATVLITQGEIGPAEPVVVYLEKSHDVIISFLGVLKAGGCYVPLDPSNPKKRTNYILENSQSRLIIADGIPEFMISTGRQFFSAIPEKIQSESGKLPTDEEFIERECDPNQIAYVIYTSGSTGQPKGCQVSHRNVVRLFVNDKSTFDFSESDVWLVAHSFAFDFSVWEMYGALLFGGKVVIADRDDIVNTRVLRNLLSEHKVTILNQTPAAFSNLISVERMATNHDLDKHLRMVMFGGDRLSLAALKPWIEYYPTEKIKLLNLYGITETTVHVTSCVLTDAQIMTNDGSSPIGDPLPETQVYIFDEYRQQQPIGIPGEMWIGGSGVCQGYFNQPTLTASRFITTKVTKSELDGAEKFTQRLYRSGDVGCRLEDGSLEYLGRNDNQVQIRGFRIELGEIEAHLNQFPDVEKSFVSVYTSVVVAAASSDLVAYVVPANKLFSETLLRNYLVEQLPVYMVPTFIVVIDEMPLTVNGKIDTARLPIPGYQASVFCSEPTRALTQEQSALAKLWSEVLGHNVDSATDNFFEIGGQSLKAVQLSLLIEREYQKSFSLRNIFSAPTIEQQCELLSSAHSSPVFVPTVSTIPALATEPDESVIIPLSPTQRRLWTLEELGLVSGVYHIYGANLLVGDLNSAALGQALNKVIQRHSVLRTVFVSENAIGYQKIRPFSDTNNLHAVDLSSEAEAEQQARLLCQKDASAPFDLSAGPLYRFKLYKLDSQRHVFSINLHHLISDGWSQSVLVTDLMSCYDDFCQQRSSSANVLKLQYYDYAFWIDRLREGGGFDGHKNWWRQQFIEDIVPLALPSDRSRPNIQAFSGDILHFELPEALSKLVRQAGLEEQQSVYAVLLTAVKVLLHRYSGQNDIVVGSAEAGRSDLNLSDQVGFYANVLVLRDEVESDDCWRGLLGKVGHTLVEALEHRDYPFDELVEDLAIPRDISRSPLFDVVVSMLPRASLSRKQKSDLSQSIDIQPFAVSQPVSRFDLTFYFSDAQEGAINGGIEFSSGLFNRSRIERMAGHFTQLLESGLNNPDQPISDLQLLTDFEIEEVNSSFNRVPPKNIGPNLVEPLSIGLTSSIRSATSIESTSELGPVELFLRQVKNNPQSVAVHSQADCLSYQQLNEQSEILATWLLKMGSINSNHSSGERSEQRVAVLFGRHPRMIVSVLAVLRAGFAYVPLDPSVPEARLSFILDDSESIILLTESSQIDYVPSDYNGLVCAIDSEWESIYDVVSAMPNLKEEQDYSPQRLAYIIYTSGSTGQPKGVLIELDSIVSLVKNTNYIDITAQDRLLQTGSLAFDASTFEIWGAILNGASLYLPSRDELLDPATFASSLYDQSISVVFLTTSLFNQFSAFDASIFANLRVLMTGGEKVSLSHINSVQQACPGVELLHVYGPTENTTFSTYYRVTQKQVGDVPIGYPVTGSSLYILDQKLQLCPIGVPGEIYLGGAGLARGYLLRKDLTRNSFIEMPASLCTSLEQNSEMPARLYRTGDIAVWLEDGAVQYTGRIDNQVKIRGFRVEPEELELHLKALSSVSDAAVKARQTSAGTWELVAWIVLMSDNTAQGNESAQIDLQQINDEIALNLPAYMLPSAWGILDAMPMKSTGKIDREALPKPEFTLSRQVNELVGAKSTSESLLLSIWKVVLGFSEIGITDNFFELGGDSIKVIQVISRLRKKGFTLEAKRLYEEPTIIAVAPYLMADKERVSKDPVIGPVRLSPIQSWFFEHFKGPIAYFNQSVLLVCKDRIDIAKLSLVLGHLQTQHDALRMQYLAQPDGSYQQICQPIDFPVAIEVMDLENDDDEAALAEMNRLQAGINLQTGPLFKVLLIRTGLEDRLFVVTHHLVVDGVSWRLLLEELEALYTTLATDGGELPVVYRSDSYKDWTEWLYHFGKSDGISVAYDYWNSIDNRDDFADYLNTNNAGTAGTQSEAAVSKNIVNGYGGEQTIAFQLDTTKTQQLILESGKAYHTDVQDLLLAAFSLALYRWQELQSVMINLEGHGRESLSDSPMIDSTIGWFTCLYPYQLNVCEDNALSSDQSFAVLIRNIKESVRKIPNKGLSYGVIQQYPLEGRKVEKVSPLISFNYLGQFDQLDDVPDAGLFTFGENASTNIDPDFTMPHAVDFSAIINNNRLIISLRYHMWLFDEVSMQLLLSHVEGSLNELLNHCLGKESSENTASDFEFADMDEDDFDSILNNL